MIVTQATIEKMTTTLGLEVLEPTVQEAIINRFGVEVLESAVANFLLSQGEWEQAAFESWVTEHDHDDDMLEQLVTLYPEFGKILVTELLRFKKVFEENKN